MPSASEKPSLVVDNPTTAPKPDPNLQAKDTARSPDPKTQTPVEQTTKPAASAAPAGTVAKEPETKSVPPPTTPPQTTPPAGATTNASAGANKAASPATPEPPNNTGNSTIKELGKFFQGKLTPVFEGGVFASYSLDALTTESTGATSIRFTDEITQESRERTVDSNFGLGQRVVLGIRGEAVGYRGSYANFVEETSRFDRPDFRTLWPDLSSMSRIDMHVADLELTQKHAINDICLESFFGVRYAEYRGSDMAVGIGKFATNLEAHAIAHSFRETQGIGPTFGLSGKKRLPWTFGCGMFESCETNDCGNLGWSCFWSIRGSVLRSKVTNSAFSESQVGVYSPDTGVQGIARSSDKSYLDQATEMNLLSGEFQLGLEYCRPLSFIPASASIRTSLVCQYWDTGPGVATSQSYATLSGNSPDFSGRVDSFAVSDNRNLNLFGMNLSVGLNY